MNYTRKLISGLPHDQKWICLSFLRSKDANNTVSVVGIRCAGVYPTEEEANTRAKEVQQEDTRFHVFVGPLNGDFLPFDPAINTPSAGASEYADEQLNALMKGHEDSQHRAKLFHELRKNEKMIENINENVDAQSKNKDDLTKKLSKAKTIDEVKTLTTCIDNIDSTIQKLEKRLEECVKNETELKTQTMGMPKPADD